MLYDSLVLNPKKSIYMAYMCEICGKGKQYGHNVSFSQRKTNKVWKPNLQKKRMDMGDGKLTIKVCTQCLRTLKKYQLDEVKSAAA